MWYFSDDRSEKRETRETSNISFLNRASRSHVLNLMNGILVRGYRDDFIAVVSFLAQSLVSPAGFNDWETGVAFRCPETTISFTDRRWSSGLGEAPLVASRISLRRQPLGFVFNRRLRKTTTSSSDTSLDCECLFVHSEITLRKEFEEFAWSSTDERNLYPSSVSLPAFLCININKSYTITSFNKNCKVNLTPFGKWCNAVSYYWFGNEISTGEEEWNYSRLIIGDLNCK